MGKRLVILLTVLLVCSAIIAAVLGVASGLLNMVFHKVLEQEINKQMTLVEGHVSYEQLQSPSVPTYKSLYFFNLTNPEDFEAGIAKPQLQEIGPYSYNELRFKNIQDSDDISQLSYTQTEFYFFNGNTSGSGLSESDIICTINIPLMVGVYTVIENPDYLNLLKFLISITSVQLYTCQNVSGLVWGYTDPFLQMLYDMGFIPTEKSWLMTNGSTSTASNSIYTGVGNISRLAEFLEWNGHKYVLDTWRSPEANQIRGTEGMFFKPNLQLGQPLVLFMGNLLRSFDLQNTGTVDHLGMETLRYEFDSRVFRGAFSDPGNARWDSWCPDGLFYVGPVKDPEIPVYVSKPHFLDGDSGLLEGVDGLDPSRESHDSHIDVEPTFGVNVDFSIRFQLNVRVNISSNFSFLEDVQGVDGNGSLFLPVLYISEHTEFSQELKDYLDESGLKLIRQLQGFVTVLFYALAGLACVSAVASMVSGVAVIWSVLRMKQDKEEMKPLLDSDLPGPTAIVHQYFAKNTKKPVY